MKKQSKNINAFNIIGMLFIWVALIMPALLNVESTILFVGTIWFTIFILVKGIHHIIKIFHTEK